jgi:hypothetical protein
MEVLIMADKWTANEDNQQRNSADAAAQDQIWEPNLETGPDFTADTEDVNLEAVPDADAVAPNSPKDPVSPRTNAVNGTDLLNGAGADDPDNIL